MKNHIRLAIIVLSLSAVILTAGAQERDFGLGVIIGEPTGISAKLWTSPTTAFDLGLGWSVGGNRYNTYEGTYDGEHRVLLHLDYLWHSFDVIHSKENFPLFYGVGGRVISGGGDNIGWAVRGVVGIAWIPSATPIDIFFELVPTLQLAPSTGFGIDAGLGARYFF